MTSTPGTPGPRTPDEGTLARYLLGELSPPEEAAIEEALGDDDVWDVAQRAESELLDAYASGGLAAAQRQRIAERLATSPRLRERVAVRQDLHTIARSRRRPRRGRPRFAAMGALAMVAVLVVFVVVRGRGTGPDAAPEVAVLALAPTTRAGAMPVVRVSRTGVVELSVVIDAEEAFPRYRVRITGPAAQPWSQDGVVASEGTLVLRVPASALAEGVHEVEITGLGAEDVRLGARSFRVAF